MKPLISAMLFMALTTTAKAQNFNYGVTAGPNMSTVGITGANGVRPKFLSGFQAGGFAEFPLANKISLRPELQYITLGYKFPATEDGNGWILKSNYIIAPVTAEYALTDKLKAGAGAYVSLKLNVKGKNTPPTGSGEDPEMSSVMAESEEPYEENYEYSEVGGFRSLDLGLRTGVSYQVMPKVGASLRYHHGLTNITGSDDRSKWMYRYFTLGISYNIR